ncbi:MAG TPA: sugar phosphate isomerase/epimerase family protein [Sediminibacterium sp.]|nr:sugar phosphate isomerase/epimerase family protein [Sediminibacterium sp.]
MAPLFPSFKEVAIPSEAGQGKHLKLSLNAYSFNDMLKSKSMSIEELIDFCAQMGFEGIDLTGYYFPGYPQVPSDEFLYKIKRRAHLAGLSISGTGIKNDFAQLDAEKRKKDIQLVKDWIIVAAKLGAPVIRIFSGVDIPKGYSWEVIATWMAKDIQECVDFGKSQGVIVALQNHNDFIKNALEVQDLFKLVNREWFGLVLDIGSYQQGDPFSQIQATIPLAVNWQLKEEMYQDGKAVKTDVAKILKMILSSNYRGFIPIETLGKGDPKQNIAMIINKLKGALNNLS